MLKGNEMKKFMVFAVVAVAAFATQAQQLVIGTGNPNATYSKMFKEAIAVCNATGMTLVEKPNDGGSLANIDGMLKNQINGAFVQSDVLFRKAQTENLSNIKTLFAFHPEPVHFVTKAEGKKTGTLSAIGLGDTVYLKNVEQLAGKTVASWGGSLVSAYMIEQIGDVSYKIVDAGSPAAAKKMLDDGSVDAVVATGGYPLGFVEQLNANYRLMTMGSELIKKLDKSYKPIRLREYSNMGQNGRGIQTVTTDALLVTRQYKSPQMQNAMKQFRECLVKNVDMIKETLNTHPSWQYVDVENKGVWSWYELN